MAAMDDDFDLLMDDIDFDFDGSSKKSQPKNVVFSTGLDAIDSIKESFDPRDKIREIVRETMPSAVRSEYADLESAMDEIKDEASKSIANIKSTLKDVSGVVGDLLPEGKMKNKLKDFAKKEGYNDNSWQKTKEEEENEKIKAALLEALGESNEEEKNAEVARQALQEKREATSQLVLKHIYAELKVANNFSNRLTSKYYNKSLELQYRQLYKLSELVELTKVGWESNRKQVESLLINSSLPDLIKLKALQAANDPRLKERAKNSYLGTYFKRFNPFENLKNNIVKNIKTQTAGFTEGLQAILSQGQMVKDLKDSGLGLGPGAMMGTMIGDFIRANTLGAIGDRLGKTKQGQNFIFGFKNMMADPRAFFKDLKENESGTSTLSKWKRRLFGGLSSLTGTPDKSKIEFINENLDDAKAFDGRAHQALVKVIPGMLGNIYGAIKTGLKVKDEDVKANAMYFDNKTGGFTNRAGIVKSLNRDLKASVNKDGYKRNMESLFRIYNGDDYNAPDVFSEQEKRQISGTIAKFMMSNGGRVNPSTLTSEDFLSNFKGSLRKKLEQYGSMVLSRGRNDPYVLDEVKSALTGIRESMPSINNRLQDLHRSGQLDIARGMKLVKQDGYGRYTVNDRGTDRTIERLAGSIDFGTTTASDGETQVANRLEEMRARGREVLNDLQGIPIVGGMASRAMGVANRFRQTNSYRFLNRGITAARGVRDRARNAINSRLDAVVNFLDQDTDEIAEQLKAKKAKLESVINPTTLSQLPGKVKSKIKSSFDKAQNEASKTLKDIDTKIKWFQQLGVDGVTGRAHAEATKILDKGKKQIAEVSKLLSEDLNTMGLPPEKIEAKIQEYNEKVKAIKTDVEKQLKDSPNVKAVMSIGSVKSAMKSGKGLISKARGAISGGLKGLLSFASRKEAIADEVYKGNEAVLKQKAKEELEEMRDGSYENRKKEWEKGLDEDGKNLPKTSLFSTKSLLKGAAIGGLGFLAIQLLRKLGIGMEDVIEFGRGMWNTLSWIGGHLIDGLKLIGSGLGWLGDKVKSIAGFFGLGGDDEEAPGGGGGGGSSDAMKYAGGIAATGIAAGAARWAWRSKGGRAVRMAGRFGYDLAKTAVKMPLAPLSGGRIKVTNHWSWDNYKNIAKNNAASNNMLGNIKDRFFKPKQWDDLKPGTASKLPTKGAEKGPGLFAKLVNWIKGKFGWLGEKAVGMLNSVKDKAIKILEAFEKAWTTIKSKFKFLGKAVTKPKVIARVGGNVAKKVAARVGALALAATGIGAIITAGFAIWDLGWILKYWLVDDMTFWSAVSKQLLGIDLFNKDEQKALELTEENVSTEIDKIAKEEEKKQVEEYLAQESGYIQKEEAITPPDVAKQSDDYLKHKTVVSVNGDGNVVVSKGDKSFIMDPKGNVIQGERFYDPDNMTQRSDVRRVSYTTSSGGVNNPKQLKPNYDFSKYGTPKQFQYTGIGSISGWFESRSRPGVVSSGKGDLGGASYGTWQLASNPKIGTLQAYLAGSKYRSEFAGMAINSPEFKAKWQEIGMRDPVGFQKDQEAFIKKTHYDPCARKLATIGLDLNKRSDALKAAVFSAAVHYGADGAYKAIADALYRNGLDAATASDEDIINAIYDYKLATVDQKFRSSSINVRNGIRKRAVVEKGMVLSLLANMPAPNLDKSVTDSGVGATSTTSSPSFATGEMTNTAATTTGGLQRVSSTTSSGSSSVSTSVSTNTIGSLGPVENLLKQSLRVQQEMLKSLVEIATNTAVLGTVGSNRQQETTSYIPQPVISLERQERFDI